MSFESENMFLNYSLIMEKISDIKKSLAVINRIAAMHLDDFLSDEIIMSGAKYQLILAIEAAQSICNHLAARVAKVVPTSYGDCFRVLAENRIISRELSSKLIAMAKFRNLLVHQYGKIDNSTVYSILKNDIKDLVQYIDEINSFLLSVKEAEE